MSLEVYNTLSQSDRRYGVRPGALMTVRPGMSCAWRHSHQRVENPPDTHHQPSPWQNSRLAKRSRPRHISKVSYSTLAQSTWQKASGWASSSQHQTARTMGLYVVNDTLPARLVMDFLYEKATSSAFLHSLHPRLHPGPHQLSRLLQRHLGPNLPQQQLPNPPGLPASPLVPLVSAPVPPASAHPEVLLQQDASRTHQHLHNHLSAPLHAKLAMHRHHQLLLLLLRPPNHKLQPHDRASHPRLLPQRRHPGIAMSVSVHWRRRSDISRSNTETTKNS
jgi:hypothetical protein